MKMNTTPAVTITIQLLPAESAINNEQMIDALMNAVHEMSSKQGFHLEKACVKLSLSFPTSQTGLLETKVLEKNFSEFDEILASD